MLQKKLGCKKGNKRPDGKRLWKYDGLQQGGTPSSNPT